jgi:hypothetical protein
MTTLNENDKVPSCPSEWIQNHKQLRRNLVCSVVSLPENIKPELVAALHQIFELHSYSISGLSRSLRLSDDEGIYTLHDESGGTVSFQIPELYGYPVFNALKTFVMEHFVGKSIQDDSKFELLFIEPDPTFTCVSNAWLLRDVRFCIGQLVRIDGVRDINIPQQPVTYDLSITGRYEQNQDFLISYAQEQLDAINVKAKYSAL